MAGALLKRENWKAATDTNTDGRWREDTGRTPSTNQGMPEATGSYERHGNDSPPQPCWQMDFSPLAFETVGTINFCCLSLSICSILLRQPQKANTFNNIKKPRIYQLKSNNDTSRSFTTHWVLRWAFNKQYLVYSHSQWGSKAILPISQMKKLRAETRKECAQINTEN